MKNIYLLALLLGLAMLTMSCEGSDDDKMKIDYPATYEDLVKVLHQSVDFTAISNPDTLTYSYDADGRVVKSVSSRNNYEWIYTYNGDHSLEGVEQRALGVSNWMEKRAYAYGLGQVLVLAQYTTAGSRDSLVWALSGDKAVSCQAFTIKNNVVTGETLTEYEWSGENLVTTSRYNKIDFTTSFDKFQDFPAEMEKTLEQVADFYNLILKAEGEPYYLEQENVYQSYNDVINVERYTTAHYPVTMAQQVPEVIVRYSYDDEKRKYTEAIGYTTCNKDAKGYPERVITGGAGVHKRDFIYQ